MESSGTMLGATAVGFARVGLVSLTVEILVRDPIGSGVTAAFEWPVVEVT